MDLGSVARLMRRWGMAGAFAVAGMAAVGWILWDVPGKHPRSAQRKDLGSGAEAGRTFVEEDVRVGSNDPSIVEAWYALTWTETEPRRDPFGEPASQSIVRDTKADREPHIHAVWLQDGVCMAVIDGRRVQEGGMHQGYRVEHCEAGAVWLTAGGVCRRWGVQFSSSSDLMKTREP